MRVHSAQSDDSVGRRLDGPEQEQQRALAAPGGAHHRGGFPGAQREVHAVQDPEQSRGCRVILDEPRYFEALGHGPCKPFAGIHASQALWNARAR